MFARQVVIFILKIQRKKKQSNRALRSFIFVLLQFGRIDGNRIFSRNYSVAHETRWNIQLYLQVNIEKYVKYLYV